MSGAIDNVNDIDDERPDPRDDPAFRGVLPQDGKENMLTLSNPSQITYPLIHLI